MSFSKEDQLLEKLQKCVGKLEGRERQSFQSQRQVEPYAKFQNPQAKIMREKYQNNYMAQNIIQPISRQSLQPQRPKWNTTAQRAKVQPFQNKYRNQVSQLDISANYLTERKDPYANEQPKPYIRKDRTDRTEEIKKKYDMSTKLTVNQPPKRPNVYVPSSNHQRTRRPLGQYDLNISVGDTNRLNRQNKQNMDQRLTKKYDIDPQPKTQRNYQNSASKYDTYNYNSKTDKTYNTNTNRRNSISHNYNYNQNVNVNKSYNSSAIKPKNYDLSTKIQSYEYKGRQSTSQFNKVIGSNLNLNSNSNLNLNLNSYQSSILKSDRNQEILPDSRLRQFGSKQKSRIGGIGSIASVSKRVSHIPQAPSPVSNYTSLQSIPQPPPTPTVSYQTFQPKQITKMKQLNLKQILDDVGNANQDTFTKLQKISQLNERINQRIKNIIDTFQTK